jgi:hypothetical protein
MVPGKIHARLHDLAGKAGRGIFERLNLVNVLLQDRKYIAETYVDESRALDALEGLYFGDLAGSRGLAALMSMYRAYQEEKTWAACKWNLSLLLGKYDKEHPETKQAGPTRQTIKRSEHEAVKQELAEQKYHRRQEQDELAALRQENVKLKQENAELRGRLSELERLLDKRVA